MSAFTEAFPFPRSDQCLRADYSARMLGSLSIARWEPGQTAVPVELSIPAKARRLLGYLLLNKSRQVSRQLLAFQFWVDLPERKARHALSQVIWQIQQAAPGLITKTPDLIGLNPNISIHLDIEEFSALVQSGLSAAAGRERAIQDLKRAVQMYTGDLLEDIYDDWLLVDRERWRELYICALEKLVVELKTAGCYDEALLHGLALVRKDPLRESACRELMKIHHIMGYPGAAILQFNELRAILKRDLGLEPEAETAALAKSILQSRGQSVSPAPLARVEEKAFKLPDVPQTFFQPLFGRARLRAEMLRLVGLAQQGSGGFALVEGEAGIGKSRLLQEVVLDAEWRGFQALWSRSAAVEGVSAQPALFQALASGLTPLRVDQLFQLMPVRGLQVLQAYLPGVQQRLAGVPALSQLEPEAELHRLVEALVELLGAWAQINPVLIVLEDLQWGDEFTLTLLSGLLPALEQIEVLVIGSLRSEDMPARDRTRVKLQELTTKGRWRLEGLDEGAAAELIRFSLGYGGLENHSLARLYAASRGNPLFLTEMLRSLVEQGRLVRDDGAWQIVDPGPNPDASPLPFPPTLERLLQQRLAQLPPDLLAILSSLAVLGNRFTAGALAALDIPAPALHRAISNLLARRLILETDQDYCFSHEQLYQVVYTRIPEDERKRIHQRVAETLEVTHPDQVEKLAYHFSQSHAWEKALEYHRKAARKAKRLNHFSAAVEFLTQAIASAQSLGLENAAVFELLFEREAIFDLTGDRAAQQGDLESMEKVGAAQAVLACRASLRRARFECAVCRFTEAEAAAQLALQQAASLSSLLQAEAMAILGTIFDGRGEVEKAIRCYQEAIQFYHAYSPSAEEQSAAEIEVRKLLANALSKTDQFERARAEILALLPACERKDDQPGVALLLLLLGVITDNQGASSDAAIGYLERSLQICRQIGHRYLEAHILLNLHRSQRFAGQTKAAGATLRQALNLCRSVGERRGEAMAHYYHSIDQAELFGELEAAREEARLGLEIIIPVGDSMRESLCLTQLGAVEISLGNLDAARAYLEAGEARAAAVHFSIGVLGARLGLARLAFARQQYAEALSLVELIEAQCKHNQLSVYLVRAQYQKMQIYLELGRFEDALQTARQAEANLKPGYKFNYPVLYSHSLALSALGKREAGMPLLEEAFRMVNDLLADHSPEQRQRCRQRIPVIGSILADWEAVQPRIVTVRLSRCTAPTGRPLRADEWVEVSWTVWQPGDEQAGGKVSRRRRVLLRLLAEASSQGGSPSYEQLAEILGVSVRTVAADLAFLKRELPGLPYTPR